MSGYLRTIKQHLVAWWRSLAEKEEEQIVPIATEVAAEASSLANAAVTSAEAEQGCAYGEFHFRGAILDELDEYFVLLNRLKKADRQSFDYYKEVGMHLLPKDKEIFSLSRLSVWFRRQQPTFGAVAFTGETPTKERVYPRFLYFRKYKPGKAPSAVQPVGAGAIYVVTVYWDDPKDPHFLRTPTEFAVCIQPDGEVRVLKCFLVEKKKIRAKRGHDRGRTFSVPDRRWGIHPFFKGWAEEHSTPVERFLEAIFYMAASGVEAANAAVLRVEARKNGLSAVFAGDVKRSSYFFRDRETTVTQGGTRRRIFHIVRPHERVLPSGKQTVVKMHFRGERDFMWNGYDVRIRVPGRDHTPTVEFDDGMLDGYETPQCITMGAAGLMVGERLRRPVLR
jgi:hypothetical protein